MVRSRSLQPFVGALLVFVGSAWAVISWGGLARGGSLGSEQVDLSQANSEHPVVLEVVPPDTPELQLTAKDVEKATELALGSTGVARFSAKAGNEAVGEPVGWLNEDGSALIGAVVTIKLAEPITLVQGFPIFTALGNGGSAVEPAPFTALGVTELTVWVDLDSERVVALRPDFEAKEVWDPAYLATHGQDDSKD